MKINLITLASDLHKQNKELKSDLDNYIAEVNNELMDEDIVLEENIKADGVLDAVFVASGGAEEKFLEIVEKLSDPFILFSTGKNNSLAASLEIKTYCFDHKISVCFLTGAAEECAQAIKHISDVFYAREKVQDTNLGVIGEPSNWLIASKVNNEDVKKTFNINLIDIQMDELVSLIDMKEIDYTHRRYNEVKEKFKNDEVVETAFAIYGALNKLIDKYNLKGLTIRCFDLLGKYKNTACLALALLNEEGIVSACEGDVPALLTMYLLYALTGRPSFMANPSNFNIQDLTVMLAHCTIPFNMVSKYDLLTHFESDVGIGIKGDLSEGPITICKIAPNFSKSDNDLIISGSIKENLSIKGFCRTQIKVQLDEQSMFEMFKQNFGNHVIVTYGDVSNDFGPLLNLFRHIND